MQLRETTLPGTKGPAPKGVAEVSVETSLEIPKPKKRHSARTIVLLPGRGPLAADETGTRPCARVLTGTVVS